MEAIRKRALVSGRTAELRVGEKELREFDGSFGGQLIGPTDTTYDRQRKIWNGSIDRRPALIARCSGVADVIAAVRFAREQGLLVALRSGGHSYPGLSVCDAGMVIDFGQMKGIRVDPEARTARVQAGVLLGELDRESQAFGLAVPAGIVTHTGLTGLTLGGGIGWLERKYGLTIDQLLSVDLVTADGEFVKASAMENPDLFWGLRGGGGNFGVVTEFEFCLNPVGPTVVAGPILWAMEDSSQIMRFYRDWITEVPDELTTIVTFRRVAPSPIVLAELHGKHVVIVGCCYVGPAEEAEEVLRRLRSFRPPLLDMCEPKPYVAHQASLDPAFPHDWWYHPLLQPGGAERRGNRHDGEPRPSHRLATDRLLDLPSRRRRPGRRGRGGIHWSQRGSHDERRRNHADRRGFRRRARMGAGPVVGARAYHQNVYVNFLMEEGEERVRQAYGREKYDRLAPKRKYDPENFFRLNQNVSPTSRASRRSSRAPSTSARTGTDDRRACPRRLGIAGRTYGIWPASLRRFADLVKLSSIRIFDEPRRRRSSCSRTSYGYSARVLRHAELRRWSPRPASTGLGESGASRTRTGDLLGAMRGGLQRRHAGHSALASEVSVTESRNSRPGYLWMHAEVAGFGHQTRLVPNELHGGSRLSSASCFRSHAKAELLLRMKRLPFRIASADHMRGGSRDG